MYKRLLVEVSGIVQGVGFRPYIYRLAQRFNLNGTVKNSSDGVSIEIEGDTDSTGRFVDELILHSPPLAQITEIKSQEIPLSHNTDFRILESETLAVKNTLISPDITICEDCSREMKNPEDRRYRYPFINCTNCGPRYTIISDIPYDRPNTSMAPFKQCSLCQKEYDDPLDRRFHAQPNACPQCGPELKFINSDKSANTTDPLTALLSALKQGKIAAIKGVGGFHLAVDAYNDSAVRKLRERKHRFEKPLALMTRDIEITERIACLDEPKRKYLSSLHRPIVLCKKKEESGLSPEISPDNDYYGIMLPYSPLHELIFLDRELPVLVMTSANISEEPICYDNDECLLRMQSIADCYLTYNRDIYIRCDDSVLQINEDKPIFIRRSRGYAPRPIILSEKGCPVLAVGAHLKNTICLTKNNFAFMGQHIGDLENLQTFNVFEQTIDHLQTLYEVRPEAIIHDLHPDYLSTKWAEEKSGLPKQSVQHHYAHILSVMAEHGIKNKIIGISLDGTGFGADGNIWGGEILLCDLNSYQRSAYFDYVPMPGGDKAINEPWRMAVSYLYACLGKNITYINSFFPEKEPEIKLICQMIDKNINAPKTSSCGRLFDAVAAILGLRDTVVYEGQAAIILESMATRFDGELPDIGEFYLVEQNNNLLIKPHEIIDQIIAGRKRNIPIPALSQAFHEALVLLFLRIASKLKTDTGIDQIALSGGCFQNMLLLNGLIKKLKKDEFTVYINIEVPPNDGGIALGQAYWGMHNI